jgi:bacteriocin-like protein
MKNLSTEEMETIEGGFPWGSFAAGVACGVGLLTAETGVGAAIAYASCATAFISD